jgi:hypothetical protein
MEKKGEKRTNGHDFERWMDSDETAVPGVNILPLLAAAIASTHPYFGIPI